MRLLQILARLYDRWLEMRWERNASCSEGRLR
jgi:hypothetical protein